MQKQGKRSDETVIVQPQPNPQRPKYSPTSQSPSKPYVPAWVAVVAAARLPEAYGCLLRRGARPDPMSYTSHLNSEQSFVVLIGPCVSARSRPGCHPISNNDIVLRINHETMFGLLYNYTISVIEL